MKQTAVQWLQQLLSLTFEQQMQFEGLFQQAKEMEKQQIEDAGNNCAFKQHLHSDRINKMSIDEPKQETLEKVANEYAKNRYSIEQGFPEEDYYISFLSFIAGAKWQQEQNKKQIETLKEELAYYKRKYESNTRNM